MDKYNIIEPTDNLNQLEADYAEWLRLPHKYRLLSNDDCQRLYQCNVYDLYIRNKEYILNKMDKEEVDPNNVVKEDIDYTQLDNTAMLLNISKKIQSSPNIVLIDPDINTIDELESRYQSFLKLLHKYKVFSHDYSLQLWGYNVDQMYDNVKKSLLSKESDQDSNNIVRENSYVNRVKAVANPIKNCLILASASCDSTVSSMFNNNENISESVDKEIYSKMGINNIGILNISLPNIVPYLNYSEMVKYNCNFNEDNPKEYYIKVKTALESRDEKSILDLGWNPSVELNEKNIRFARERQMKWFKEHFINTYDLSIDENVELVKDSITDKSIPVYLFINNPIPNSGDFDIIKDFNYTDLFNTIGVAFDLEGPVYCIHKGSSNVTMIKMSELSNVFNYLEIIGYFIDKLDRASIESYFRSNDTLSMSNLFSFILNGNELIDKTNEKLLYASIIESLMRISDSNKEYNIGSVESIRFYRLFKGMVDQINYEKIQVIINTICENPNLGKGIDRELIIPNNI